MSEQKSSRRRRSRRGGKRSGARGGASSSASASKSGRSRSRSRRRPSKKAASRQEKQDPKQRQEVVIVQGNGADNHRIGGLNGDIFIYTYTHYPRTGAENYQSGPGVAERMEFEN